MRTIAPTFPAILYIETMPSSLLLGSAIKICPAVNEMDSNCDCDNWLPNGQVRKRGSCHCPKPIAHRKVTIKKGGKIAKNNGPPNTSYSRVEVTTNWLSSFRTSLPCNRSPCGSALLIISSSFMNDLVLSNSIVI